MRQIKLASSLVNFLAQNNIVFDWLINWLIAWYRAVITCQLDHHMHGGDNFLYTRFSDDVRIVRWLPDFCANYCFRTTFIVLISLHRQRVVSLEAAGRFIHFSDGGLLAALFCRPLGANDKWKERIRRGEGSSHWEYDCCCEYAWV